MDTLIFRFGYFGIFGVSFLSATLVPLASEVFVLAMPRLGYNVWGIIVSATLGSFLGSLTNYYVGKKGTDFVFARYFQVKPETMERGERFFARWGPVALFFSWLPFIGDPLTMVAGALHINVRIFCFWVIFGKTLRYLALLGLANQVLSWF